MQIPSTIWSGIRRAGRALTVHYRFRCVLGAAQVVGGSGRAGLRSGCRTRFRKQLRRARGQARRVRLAASRRQFARGGSRRLVAAGELHRHGLAVLPRGSRPGAEPAADRGAPGGPGADRRRWRRIDRGGGVRDRPGGWLPAVRGVTTGRLRRRRSCELARGACTTYARFRSSPGYPWRHWPAQRPRCAGGSIARPRIRRVRLSR